MTTVAMSTETFTIKEEIRVRASLEKTFASLIAQMGRENQTPDGKPDLVAHRGAIMDRAGSDRTTAATVNACRVLAS